MLIRTLALAVFAFTPLAVQAADNENPFKKAKVGDYAKYDATLQTGGNSIKTVRIQTVTAASEKEISLKTVTVINGKESPNKKGEQKIDLTQPFDPVGDGVGGRGTKWEKLKDGKEKVKVGNKEYDCTWTTYKAAANEMVEGELKVWLSKDVPFVVKRTVTLKSGMNDFSYTTELVEFGNKK